jgi:hypothetical protein
VEEKNPKKLSMWQSLQIAIDIFQGLMFMGMNE